ncbi:unnamed protein product, partial [Rotaria sp. Silwood1]
AGQTAGGSGSGSSDLFRPSSVTFDQSGNMYIADSNNHRVQFWLNNASSGTTVAGIT